MSLLVGGLFSTADSYGSGTAIFEILLMLLVAFILGYLLRLFLSGNSESGDYKSKYDELLHKYDLLKNQNEIHQKENRRLVADLVGCQDKSKMAFAGGAAVAKEPIHKDNLKKIEGIGPKIEQLLYNAGVYTWEALSQTSADFIKKLLNDAGPRYKMHNPATWPQQAKMAAQGKWDALKKWQDELKGGRPV